MNSSDSAVVVFGQGERRDAGRMRGGSRAVSADAATLLCRLALEAGSGSGADILLAGDEDLAASRPAGVSFILQRGCGFGDRFRNAVRDAFALGYRRVIIVGTDTPGLSAGICRTALARLTAGNDRTVVVGPSRDGGYYLLGLNRFVPEAFAGIPWRTRRVLAATRRALAGFCMVTLRTLTDADDAGSLARAASESASSSAAVVALRRLVSRCLPGAVVRAAPALAITLVTGFVPARRGPPRLAPARNFWI